MLRRIIVILLLLISPLLSAKSTFYNLRIINLLRAQNIVAKDVAIEGDLVVSGKIIALGDVPFTTTQGSSTPHAAARFADGSGALLEDSSVLIDDAGNIQINGITKNGNTVTWPSNIGAAGTFLTSDGVGNLVYTTAAGAGNVSTALPFTTNNAILTTDTPNGMDNIKESAIIIDNNANITGVNTLTANTINATLNGNAATATSATNFSGLFVGDVIGNQGATVVSLTGGQTAANVAAATLLANASTNINTPSTIIRRDASGNFSAGTITANVIGNATTATNAINTTNFTGSLAGDVTGTQSATAVSLVGGQTAANVALATLAANAATTANLPNAIIKRDGSGNFSAGTITANLIGNATTATSTTNTTNFTGSLVGDVTGTQSATVVSLVGGQTAANMATATLAANAATNNNTSSTIVRRDGAGNFSAGTITANLTGNATTATNTTNFSGSLAGDVTGTQGTTVVSFVGGQSAANVSSATIAANASTSTNTANTIVSRDSSGNFIAGTITANVTGDVTGNLSGNATTATNAITATNFSGSLSGDVTGNQATTVVNSVGGQSAANIASATVLTNAATNDNIAGTLVRRDGAGNFSASAITANLIGNATTATTATNATNFSGPLVGDVIGTQNATIVSLVGGQTAANVASATVAANASTSTNTANAIVSRDSSGNFSAGTIAANLTGNVTGNLSGNATTATNAITATNFSGSLSGDVTGNQTTTVVNTVGGQTASNIASATILANAATNDNTASTIVRRDGAGNFSASTITANVIGNVTGNLSGNATTAASAISADHAFSFLDALVGDVTGTQNATIVSLVGGQSTANVASATIAANAATSNNAANTIVKRDVSGNFNTNMISISGTTTNPNDVATKAYVDSTAALGLSPKTPARVVATGNVAITGIQTIDGITLVNNDRVLLVAQTNAVQNGLWVVHAGAWTRPTDFASGSTVGQAYVLITAGTVNAGSSWLSTTTTAIVDTDPIIFVQFSIPGQTTAANVGTGAGQIFRDKTGITLNLKTIAAGPHMVVTNNSDDITLATDATSANTPSTIVARDGSGNFSAGTITASLTGASSQNVLKAGDTMTGNLNMATQSAVRFQDAAGGEFVGLRAPTTIGASYTLDLPGTGPTTGQFLQASSPTATQWSTIGGSPAATEIYYVALDGNDTNNGSFSAPFRTVNHAVNIANTVASTTNPIIITIGAGIFVEDNSAGPITITADGISLVGRSMTGTVLQPLDPTQNLITATTANVEFISFGLDAVSGSTASGLSITSNAVGVARITTVVALRFATGFNFSSAAGVPILLLENVILRGNTVSMAINNSRVLLKNSIFLGPFTGTTAANTAVTITGSTSLVTILGTSLRLLTTGIVISGGAMRLLATNIEAATNGIIASGGSSSTVVGCNFVLNNASSVNVSATGAGTLVEIDGSNFQCNDAAGNPQGTALFATTAATINADSCSIESAVIGIQCGAPGDIVTTVLTANGTILRNNTIDVLQNGAATFKFLAGVFDPEKITIANPTNVSFAAFDNEAVLTIGTNSNVPRPIYEILNGQSLAEPRLDYEPNYYGNQGTVFRNRTNDPTFNATEAQANDAHYYVVTGDRTKEASVNLISDTGNVGAGDNVRGWTITKRGTSADLAFTYTNNDTSGQAARGPNNVMQLNGFDNQVEFPTATNTPLPTNIVARLVWAGDTNLYRASANTLQTDGNLVVDGNLNLPTQSEIRFEDAVGGEFVGLRAPTAVGTSYTVDLPETAPTIGQFLQASSPTTTQWSTIGGSPTVAKTYYVDLSGNDTNDGSLSAPFRTVNHAVNVANTVATITNPIVIRVGAGIFIEDNSGGPITITANGISIVGRSMSGTVIQPLDPTTILINCTTANVELVTFGIDAVSGSTASGLSFVTNTPGVGRVTSIAIQNFATGFNFSSGGIPTLLLENVQTRGNSTSMAINNGRILLKNSLVLGAANGATPANTAITITGSSSVVNIIGTSFRLLTTGITISGSSMRLLNCNIESTTNGLVISGGSNVGIIGSNFATNSASSVNVFAAGANTQVTIDGSNFQGLDALGNPQGTALRVTTAAAIEADFCFIENVVLGIQCGTPSDIDTTVLIADSMVLRNCTADILQNGSSKFQFLGGIFTPEKTTIANPTNVSFAAFDDEGILTIGTTDNIARPIYEILNGQSLAEPRLVYEPNYYGNQGTVFRNRTNDPIFNATEAQANDAHYYVVTGDRTKETNINLISDTGNVGVSDNVRGWAITKLGTSASLAFTYTNNDTSGQAARGPNSVMQLNGFDNQVEFPLATNTPLPTNTVAKLNWAGDTTLYRSTANTLKTDGNLVVGALNTTGIVHNDTAGLLSTSLIVNADVSPTANIVDTTLATISTAGKVANSATTATSANTINAIVARDGSGNFSAGTITANLNGNATTATTATNATNFSGSLAGDVTGTQGATVVSLVGGQTAANVAAGTVLANASTSANTPNTIVRRDGSGNFSAGTITANLNGNATTATTATNATNFSGSLAGDVTGTQGATVVSLVGGQTAANVAAGTVLANASTNANTPNTIVRRDGSGNFSASTISAALTGAASLNVLKAGDTMTGTLTHPAGTAAAPSIQFTGSTNTGISAATANTLSFDTTGAERMSISSGGTVAINGLTPAGVVHNDASGNLSTSLVVNTDVSPTAAIVDTKLATISTAGKVANSATTATSANTINAIVARDGSGNFSAGTITANLNGNATTATTATNATNFSGSLAGDVTGTQGATVVSLVGGQTAANVAAGAVLANASTNANTPSTIVRRDGSGNFSAGTITANLNGNATTATTATNATNFSGSLAGDVTGTQGATVVSLVGGQTAANVAAGAVLANASTNANTPSTIVRRDGSGNFSAGTITANLNGNATTATTATNATNFSGSLAGDVTGTQGATVVSLVGGQTAANVAAGAVLANASTSANTPSTIVRRDASGNFSAGTITASVTGASSLNVLKAGDTMTGTLTLPAGTAAAPSIQFTGSTNTGISAATANRLSLDTSGVERMSVSSTSITMPTVLILTNLMANQAIQSIIPVSSTAVTVNSTTAVLLLKHAAAITNFTVNFPPNPIDGQLFTILLGTTFSITLTNAGGTGSAVIVNGITSLNPTTTPPTNVIANTSVTYFYSLAANTWYRYSRG